MLSPPFYFMQITLVDFQNEKSVSSLIIAESLDLDIRSVDRLISKYIDRLKNYGQVRFEITPQNKKIYYLNENQSLFLGTLSKNTERVIEFKEALVNAFDKLRKPKTFSTLDVIKLNLKVIEQLEAKNKELEVANTELATRSLEVKTEKEYKWKVKVIRDDLGKMINYYVKKHFLPFSNNSYSLAHTKAKKEYKAISGVDLPTHISLASAEAKREYLNWLSRI